MGSLWVAFFRAPMSSKFWKTNSKASLLKTNSKASLLKTNSKASLLKTNSKASLLKTNSKASLLKTNSKASLLKTRKEFKDQKEIFACALQKCCSEIGKAQGEPLCRNPVLETLPCNFIKTGLHCWHLSRNVPTFFGKIISQKHLWTTDWKGCSIV